MALTYQPPFVQTPVCGLGQVGGSANTSRDNPGATGLVTLYTVGSNGGRIEAIRAKAGVTTTAGMVRIFVSTDGGTNKRLFAELQVTAITVGANTASWEGEFLPTTPLVLPANAVVYGTSHNAEIINVFVHGGDY